MVLKLSYGFCELCSFIIFLEVKFKFQESVWLIIFYPFPLPLLVIWITIQFDPLCATLKVMGGVISFPKHEF